MPLICSLLFLPLPYNYQETYKSFSSHTWLLNDPIIKSTHTSHMAHWLVDHFGFGIKYMKIAKISWCHDSWLSSIQVKICIVEYNAENSDIVLISSLGELGFSTDRFGGCALRSQGMNPLTQILILGNC